MEITLPILTSSFAALDWTRKACDKPTATPPNRRLQRTALRAREIRAILKALFGPTTISLSNAPPLKRKTLGRLSHHARFRT